MSICDSTSLNETDRSVLGRDEWIPWVLDLNFPRVWGSHSDVAEDLSFLGCYPTSCECTWCLYLYLCLVCRSGGNCSSLLTGIPSTHSHRLIIPDDVLTQFDLLMMSTVMLETCREMKCINKYMKKCIRLVINKNSCLKFVWISAPVCSVNY